MLYLSRQIRLRPMLASASYRNLCHPGTATMSSEISFGGPTSSASAYRCRAEVTSANRGFAFFSSPSHREKDSREYGNARRSTTTPFKLPAAFHPCDRVKAFNNPACNASMHDSLPTMQPVLLLPCGMKTSCAFLPAILWSTVLINNPIHKN